MTLIDRAAFALAVVTQSLIILLSVLCEILVVGSGSENTLINIVAAAIGPFLALFWLLPVALVALVTRAIKRILAVLITVYSFIEISLILYHLHRRFTFDFGFLWYHLSDAVRTIEILTGHIYLLLIGILLILWLHFRGVLSLWCYVENTYQDHNIEINRNLGAAHFLAASIIFAVTGIYIDSESKRFVLQFFVPPSDTVVAYTHWFNDSLRVNRKNWTASSPVQNRNLIMIQLESLNAELVSKRITPNFIQAGEQYGVLFPRIQGSSVLTIRAQESILCSVLPSLRESITQSPKHRKGLVCLPEVLRRHGFKTVYYQSYPDFSFANRDVIFRELGFDELHSADIAHTDDELLSWGYAEAVFYRRVLDHLENHYSGQKVFAYITMSSTNHIPFDYLKQNIGDTHKSGVQVPFPNPGTFRERISNTTFLQDHYFGSMFQEVFLKKHAANSTLIVFGDHSWPIGIHEGNIFNENFGFQENFVSSLAIIPAVVDRQKYAIGKHVTAVYSHLDLMPTILEMFGITDTKYYGRSFLADAQSRSEIPNQRCVVSVQPFGGGYIAMSRFPNKYLFRLRDNFVTKYDLDHDPHEQSPISRKTVTPADLELFQGCLSSLAS